MIPAPSAIDNYLASLRTALKSLPAREREEILSEISAHIRDSREQGLSLEQTLLQLGAPEELAAEYRDALLVRLAVQARTPWSMLTTVFRLATRGAIGAACFFIAVIGYVSGAALFVTALLKPFFPHQIGLWVGPGVFHFGFHHVGHGGGGVGLLLSTGSPAHEVLGHWYIPVTCALGVLLIWGTTHVLRRLVKRIRTKHTRASTSPGRSFACEARS